MTSKITGSDTAGINAISMPTEYYTMAFVDGELVRIGKKNVLYGVDAPETPLTNDDGSNLTLDQARAEGAKISDSFSDVSWRTPFGANMQFPAGIETFFDGLQVAAPNVNTIRVDFNSSTLKSPHALAEFRDFTGEAADRGYKLIIQYSDGEMAGRQSPDLSSHTSMTPDPSARMQEIGGEWAEVMSWFEQPGQSEILDAVYGWEIINEPMAYGKSAADGKIYAQDIVSIVRDQGIDWHGKKILVGGLGASGRFENIDHEPIRDAIGEDLVWSVHAYPDWNNPNSPDLNGNRFAKWLEDHISPVFGDDILLTEMNLGRPDEDQDGIADLFDINSGGWPSFNAARTFQQLSESGIGVTYWAANSRGSSFLLNGGKGTLDVLFPQMALINNIWSMDEIGEGGRAGNNLLIAQSSGDTFNTEFATAYGYAGDDTLSGLDGMTNMLFGGLGNDVVIGGDGDDYLFGGAGHDRLEGGAGNDKLMGGRGNDTLIGGDGDDWLEAYQGRNLIEAGSGADTIITSGGSTVSTGDGPDLIYIADIDNQHAPLRVTDFSGDDRLDLSDLADSKGRLHLRLDRASFGNGREGLCLTIPGSDGFAVVFDPESGFSGAGSLADTGIRITIDDHTGAEIPGMAFDSDTGLLTVTETPVDPEPPSPEDPGPADPGGDNPGSNPNPPDIPDDEEDEDPAGDPGGSGGACFVATAAYGGAGHPDVVSLRAFRDRHLVRHPVGRAFIRFYWVVGPHMARRVNPEGRFAAVLRAGLSRLVRRLRIAGLC